MFKSYVYVLSQLLKVAAWGFMCAHFYPSTLWLEKETTVGSRTRKWESERETSETMRERQSEWETAWVIDVMWCDRDVWDWDRERQRDVWDRDRQRYLSSYERDREVCETVRERGKDRQRERETEWKRDRETCETLRENKQHRIIIWTWQFHQLAILS